MSMRLCESQSELRSALVSIFGRTDGWCAHPVIRVGVEQEDRSVVFITLVIVAGGKIAVSLSLLTNLTVPAII